MSSGVVSGNYQGAEYQDTIVNGGNKWIKVYNTSTSAIANGACYNVVQTKDSTTGYWPTLSALATSTSAIFLIGVVENSVLGQTGIAAGSWGYVQVAGECPKVLTHAATTAQHVLIATVANAGELTTAGNATLAITSVAIAREATTSGNLYCKATLLGFRVTAS